jgi:hypothetical protein
MNISHNFKENFIKNLPHKPYCSWGKGTATLVRSKLNAIKLPLIQVNPPHLVNYLVFDIDAKDAYLHFFDADLPTPTWIAKNRKNGHCHVCYELKTPVCKTASAKLKPLRYLASIEYTYGKKLGADIGYVGLLTKNPIDQDWDVSYLNPRPFDLDELADYVDLETRPQSDKSFGLGRNCYIFDVTRQWAYKAIRELSSAGYDSWYNQVLKIALNANHAFLQPLPYNEVKSTAKSISKWVWRNHTSAEFQTAFSKKQSIRASIGVVKGNVSKGGKARSAQYSDIRREALKLHVSGMSVTQIAKQLQVSRPSIYKYINSSQKV